VTTEEVVPAALAGERLDRVVAMVADVTRAVAARLVDDGQVRVNGAVVTARAHRLVEGDRLEVGAAPDDGPSAAVADPGVPVVVVHEDDDVVVVDKPAGLVVHPGAGNATGTLVQGVLARYPELREVGDPARPGIVHRLDRDTSGLLMVARSPQAYDALVEQLAERTVLRRYMALVWGRFETPAGRIDGAIGRSRRRPTAMAGSADGRPAMTDYRVVAAVDDPVEVSVLECRLHTGRTHQIRVHLRSIGHPVVGDATYGGVRQSLVVPRLCLHAGGLGFEHPRTAEPLRFRSPLPPDLVGVLAALSLPTDPLEGSAVVGPG
jgi:23S rRNA pseudouridine1911/1915/1917 synthase